MSHNKKIKIDIGNFTIEKKCKVTRARVSSLQLQHGIVKLPIFMPVGTYGSLKAIPKPTDQIILGNTYHLRNLKKDLHQFMNLKNCLLTDSGGFQMISLKNTVSEKGVHFTRDDVFLSPERSMEIQMELNSDIVMQLDDVVCPMSDRVEEACYRSIRWLDRCISTMTSEKQLLFPIVQGGVRKDLRNFSIREIKNRINTHNLKGVAIGGLSGGEDKKDFLRTIGECTEHFTDLPVYTMGVGYPDDVLLSIAMGSDMSDCVYPTRTARFGNKLIDKTWNCDHFCCTYSEEELRALKHTTNYAMIISEHNLHFMRNLTGRARTAILEDRFADFLLEYFTANYAELPSHVKKFFDDFNISYGTD